MMCAKLESKSSDNSCSKGWNFNTVLVVGGAGSLGSVVVKKILENPDPNLVVRVFDNDDCDLSKLDRKVNSSRLRCLLGDIRDYHRLEMAVKDVDLVIHMAAVKDLSVAEYNPIETIRVNIDGLINLVEVCLRLFPKKVLFLSSDKAAESTSLYGSTKYLGEKIIRWAHQISYPKIRFASVRPGNIIESRGNVFEVWKEQSEKGIPLTVTHPEAKRYMAHVGDIADFILKCALMCDGGEIFIPEMEELSILELAKGYGKPIRITGLKPGEKLSEVLMSEGERERAEKVDGIWVIRSG